MLKKHKIAIALSVFVVLVVIIVIVAIILSLSILTVSDNHYALLYKKGEKIKLKSNKTYTSGMKWAGIGNSFHQFEIRSFVDTGRYIANYTSEIFLFNCTAQVTYDPDNLYQMWYAIQGLPTLEPLINFTRPIFEEYLNELEYDDVTNSSKDTEINDQCCEKYKEILKNDVHVIPGACLCIHTNN